MDHNAAALLKTGYISKGRSNNMYLMAFGQLLGKITRGHATPATQRRVLKVDNQYVHGVTSGFWVFALSGRPFMKASRLSPGGATMVSWALRLVMVNSWGAPLYSAVMPVCDSGGRVKVSCRLSSMAVVLTKVIW